MFFINTFVLVIKPISHGLLSAVSKLFMALKHHLTSSLEDAKAKDTDALIGSSMAPPRRSNRLKGSALTLETRSMRLLARLSQSEDDCRVSTEIFALEDTTAQAVNLVKKLPPTCSIERSRMVTRSSQPPQHESVTACPNQSSYYPQRENQPPSCTSNDKGLLNASAPLEQRSAASTANDGYGYSKPDLPTRVLLTKRTLKHKHSGNSKQGRGKLLDLPLDVLCLIADDLDVVARACLRYAHPALGYWCNGDLCNLSLCAKAGIVSLLLRDGASIPEQLRGVAKKGTGGGHCSEYQRIVPKYCITCRCYGHLSHCPKCHIRTCAREGT